MGSKVMLYEQFAEADQIEATLKKNGCVTRLSRSRILA